jgi:hypothetical protein
VPDVYFAFLTESRLIPGVVAEPIDDVIKVANSALHGDIRVKHGEQHSIARSGAQILHELNRLMHSGGWIGRVILVRAKALRMKASGSISVGPFPTTAQRINVDGLNILVRPKADRVVESTLLS